MQSLPAGMQRPSILGERKTVGNGKVENCTRCDKILATLQQVVKGYPVNPPARGGMAPLPSLRARVDGYCLTVWAKVRDHCQRGCTDEHGNVSPDHVSKLITDFQNSQEYQKLDLFARNLCLSAFLHFFDQDLHTILINGDIRFDGSGSASGSQTSSMSYNHMTARLPVTASTPQRGNSVLSARSLRKAPSCPTLPLKPGLGLDRPRPPIPFAEIMASLADVGSVLNAVLRANREAMRPTDDERLLIDLLHWNAKHSGHFKVFVNYVRKVGVSTDNASTTDRDMFEAVARDGIDRIEELVDDNLAKLRHEAAKKWSWSTSGAGAVQQPSVRQSGSSQIRQPRDRRQ